MRKFDSGATRNDDSEKPDYEGFLSPLSLIRFGEYMHLHRKQKDGTIRDSDNWQKGIPRKQLLKSLIRHVLDLWALSRGGKPKNPDTGEVWDAEDLLCAILFNCQALLNEYLIHRDAGTCEPCPNVPGTKFHWQHRMSIGKDYDEWHDVRYGVCFGRGDDYIRRGEPGTKFDVIEGFPKGSQHTQSGNFRYIAS